VPLISPVEAPGLVARSDHWAFAHSALLKRTLPLLEERWKNMGVKRLFAFYPNTPIALRVGPGQRGGRADRLGLRRDAVQIRRYRLPRPHYACQGVQSGRDPGMGPWHAGRRRD
jgi:hypothetical protein